jgi:hypothetical protein
MKAKKVVLFCCLLLLMTILGCARVKAPHPLIKMNTPWECEGNSITVTGVTVTDKYLAQDGTEYSKDTGDVLIIIRCKATMVPGWSITDYRLISASTKESSLCAPITEMSDSGEEMLLFLFGIPKERYDGAMHGYSLEMQIRSGGRYGSTTFIFIE